MLKQDPKVIDTTNKGVFVENAFEVRVGGGLALFDKLSDRGELRLSPHFLLLS